MLQNKKLPLARPSFDPAYKNGGGFPGDFDLNSLRTQIGLLSPSLSTLEKKFPHLVHSEYAVPGIKGLNEDAAPILSIWQPKADKGIKRQLPVVCLAHGGGQLGGNRFSGIDSVIDLFPPSSQIAFASIEYRLAPEYPAPAGAYDTYAGLVYLAEYGTELGIDPSNIIIYGASGGGSLAAATCLLARNRKYPPIRAQVLNVPMLDCGDHWPSVQQFETGTVWPGSTSRVAWDLILGTKERENIDEIQCPGKATDLSDLPPTFIDIGECESMRDAAVAYASLIWKSGGSAELHVWPGLYHAAMFFEVEVPVSKAARDAQTGFMTRMLNTS